MKCEICQDKAWTIIDTFMWKLLSQGKTSYFNGALPHSSTKSRSSSEYFFKSATRYCLRFTAFFCPFWKKESSLQNIILLWRCCAWCLTEVTRKSTRYVHKTKITKTQIQISRQNLISVYCNTLLMFCLLNPQTNACQPNPKTTSSDFNRWKSVTKLFCFHAIFTDICLWF